MCVCVCERERERERDRELRVHCIRQFTVQARGNIFKGLLRKLVLGFARNGNGMNTVLLLL